MSSAPAFGNVRGAGKSSLRARDAGDGGRGRGKKLLNRGMNLQNGNYIGKRDEAAAPPAPEAQEDNHALEASLGFELFTDGPDRLGWLMNMNSSQRADKESGQIVSVVNCYFMCQDGSMFKSQVEYAPYFYLHVRDGMEMEVDAWIRRKFPSGLKDVEIVEREDLDLKNHLSGLKRHLLKLSFWNMDQLIALRREVSPIVNRNRNQKDGTSAYATTAFGGGGNANRSKEGRERLAEAPDAIIDMREYDVPYHVRFAIDTDVRAGHWFIVRGAGGKISMERRPDLLQRAEVRICAFDIETTKLPLQFPNSQYDQVFMISYMIDRQGYLIINREVVSEDISDFEYTPKPEFEGPFKVFNCANEAATLRCWFDHMRTVQPGVYVTYNGDYFDWPFIETRAAKHGMDMEAEIGFKCKPGGGECLSNCAVHMDCLHWVNRDSYLPQGSRGLKAVTKYKLGYDPVEVDPEDMVRFAAEKPQAMASYSVSDAVATYYLYMTYVHPFVFSLSTIIPMPPDEVLRKGSGTLCEALLMVEAYKASVVAPNKHTAAAERMHNGHLLESETYIGGKVEALESGVFRADIPCKFRVTPDAYQELLDKLDTDLKYALEHDAKWTLDDVSNYDEVRDAIAAALTDLRDRPVREECPLIYHLDVAAMYPNIILTNRLQPSAIVTDEDCAACDFNRPGKTCLRSMEWVWRGETYTATKAEYLSLKAQLQSETFPHSAILSSGGGGNNDGGGGGTSNNNNNNNMQRHRTWNELSYEERAKLLKDRLKKYCQRVYKRVLDKPTTEQRAAGICQRENGFYYDTVRAFRDRRYEYKTLNKVWKGKLDEARASGSQVKIQEAQDMVVVYDSLQLAHKCILNSFYGYVMRKGARWYSMEMAGVVTHTGANIIKRANQLVTRIGRPLELDTDGIWCALPKSFPEDFKFTHKETKKTFTLSYPCAMLNVMVAENNTNDQFATLIDPERHIYQTSSEMTIEFEVDGPYLAMVLPASKEEGKLIKKRYAVFNFDGSLAELKGFELKRRGELKLIKVFQAEVFDQFLLGNSLEECYGAVAAVANRWIDMLDTRGVDLTDEEVIDLISQMCVMSKGLEEYDGRKSCAITCATRLAQFLGDERVKDKGLVCHYVVAAYPRDQPTSERAIPVAIFSTEPSIARTYLRKWCGGDVSGSKDHTRVPDVRDIVDWNYYKERLGSAIQKIITIPAAMQRVANPVPRVAHPDWLHKKVAEKDDKHKQTKLDVLFAQAHTKKKQQQEEKNAENVGDLEDFGNDGALRALRSSPLLGAQTVGVVTTAAAATNNASSAVDLTPEDGIGTEKRANAASRNQQDENAPGNIIGVNTATTAAIAAKPLGPSSDPHHEAGEQGDSAVPTADRHVSFTQWLRAKKAGWKDAKQQRKRRREAQSIRGDEPHRQRARTGVDDMFAQQAESVATAPWHIVSIAPTQQPGVYKTWAVINKRMYAIPLRIPRTFYLDASIPPEEMMASAVAARASKCALVRRVLPEGDEPHYTYQITLPESEYRAHLSSWEMNVSSSRIHGIYEAQVPPEWSAALAMGCVAVLGPSARGRNLGAGFDVDELLARPVMQHGYLTSPSSAIGGVDADNNATATTALKHMALHYSEDAARGRGLYALHLPLDSTCHIWIVNPARGGQKEVTSTIMEKAWSETRDDLLSELSHQDQGLMQHGERVPQCNVVYVKSQEAALQGLQKMLLRIRDRARGPTLLLLNAPDLKHLYHSLPVLHDLPCASMPMGNPTEDISQALGWQLPAAKTAARRLLAAGGWLSMRIAAAQYAHLPLSSIGADWVLDACDALFARQLRDQNHLLWTADGSQPDLGGRPRDVADALLLNERVDRVEVAWPGTYRCVCLEIKVSHLAVCAVLEAQTIGDLEGAALVDDQAGCGAAFRVLRNLAQSWVEDATRRNNICADTLLRNLYRWLCSPSSRLYDPALKSTVQGLMRKLLLQLVAELKRLGTTVVYADTSTLIVATGRHSMTAALGYADYVLSTVGKRELFRWLSMSPAKAWHTLLFADRYNYLGLVAPLPESIATAMSQMPGELASGAVDHLAAAADELAVTAASLQSPQFDCVLTMRDYLPIALHDAFMSAVCEYVWLPWRESVRDALSKAEEAAAAGEDCGDNVDDGACGSADGELAALTGAQKSWLKDALPGVFTEKLLRAVKHVSLHVGAHDGRSDHEFPHLAGSHLTPAELGTPALAFVRGICHLYSLDTDSKEAVTVLRRQLLRLIHVKEFGKEATWRDPCMTLVLPDVVCPSCQDCQDIDLCRDPRIQEKDWRCGSCGAPRDSKALESRLAVSLRALDESYQVQDLKCVKCSSVASNHLQRQCDVCGGHLKTSQEIGRVKKHVAVFKSVAEYQGMETLKELAEFLL